MFITITLKVGKHKTDIRIDSEQKISVGLEVLRESNKIPQCKMPSYFRSKQGERLVSAYKTFQEENIYDGDVLEAI